MPLTARVLMLLAALLLLPTGTAWAYVGPGLGLGALGAIAGVVLSVILAVLAIFWYPIKRLLGLGKKKPPAADDDPLD